MNSNSTTETTQERAARAVAEHPKVICTAFVSQPEPAAFWCAACGWNRPLHEDDRHEEYRQAVAAELAKLAKGDAR